jgi:peroxiredoxin/mono/diheme cytochrome c family protein
MPSATVLRSRASILAALAVFFLTQAAPAQEAPTDLNDFNRFGRTWQVAPADGLGKKIDSFSLTDADGKAWSLHRAKDHKALVVVFLSFECPVSTAYAQPLADLYEAYRGRGVAFVGVCPRDEGDAGQLARLARDYKLPFPVFRDAKLAAARALQAAVTPEVFVLDGGRVLRYRGRIDDGYQARLKKSPKVTREDLRLALDDVLAGKPVRQPATKAVGCPIALEEAPKVTTGKVTYHRDVLPILQNHCQQCHRPGGVAPFALLNYRQAVTWAADIKDYTAARKMPPWKAVAGPAFHNQRRLSDREIKTLAEWVDAKTPEGDPKDAPPPAKFAEGWQLGKPDLVLTPEEDFHLGPTGPDHFRCIVLPVKLDKDVHITAVEVHPGNPRIVHHAVLLLDRSGQARKLAAEERARKQLGPDRGPGYHSEMAAELFTNFFSGPWPLLGVWAPGQVPQHVPGDLGYYVPKGSDLVVQIHYSRSGRAEKDRTSIGLYFSKKPAPKPVEGIFIAWPIKSIPAGAERFRVTNRIYVDRDCTVYSVFPHMHLIGKEMTVTVTPPGGKARTLIRVDDWDFNWQETYYFKKPIQIPAGTCFDIEAIYDNSSKNPNNPNNPPRTVHFGLQTSNEMAAVLMEATSDRPGRIQMRRNPPEAPKGKESKKK